MCFDFKELKDIFDKLPDESEKKLAEAVKGAVRVFVHGAGRSGLMIKAFAMRLAQAGLTVYAVGDCTTPAIGEGDILIVASASGRTLGVVRCARTAKELDARVFCITASPESELAGLADEAVCFSAPNKDSENSGSLMGTLFEEALLLFFDSAAEFLGADATKMRRNHANLE
ncbi:MAG: SIS domain-containing protein [Clostridia bacterium]|nr:SIS domain-containing protein [Clostridia bacterium]